MTASREPARKAFAALLSTALVGAGLPAQAVYDHLVSDFAGASPVVVVTSGPIQRRIESFGNCYHIRLTLLVYVFVLYADGSGTWDAADAEDAADTIEALIAETVITHQHSDEWDNAAYDDTPTEPTVVEIGGLGYRRELLKVNMEITE